MTSTVLGSVAITFAIAIASIGPRANGYAINSPATTTYSTGHMDTTKLTITETVENLRKLNDTTSSTDAVIANSKDDTTIDTGYTKSDVTTTTIARTTVTPMLTTDGLKIPTITSDTVEVFDSDETKSDENHFRTVIPLPKKSIASHITIPSDSMLSTESTLVTDYLNAESKTTYEQSTQINILENIASTIRDVADVVETTTSMLFLDPTKVTSTSNEYIITKNAVTESDILLTSTNLKEESSLATEMITNSDWPVSTTNLPVSKITETSWKKYTTIFRKKIASAEETPTTEEDAMKAETTNTFMNLQDYHDIRTPSQKVKTLFTKIGMEDSQTDYLNTGNKVVSTGVPFLNTVESVDKKRTSFTGAFQSKQAGFINNSEVGETLTLITNMSGTEHVADIETTTSPNLQKVTSHESQGPLAEDVIEEELMKENALNNQEEIQRYRETNMENDIDKPTDDHAAHSLNVRPISFERTKTTLYTLSPNYKPMKKLDVQPAKQFLRDPDDNSWRNESISSLGIVFKPKNSSISFKEVLKNKTQTELNTTQEKDPKEGVPDLRVRLEKIAEVRKTKRRKTIKNGEEVYTDYEEGGSAEAHGTKVDSAGPARGALGPGSEDLGDPARLAVFTQSFLRPAEALTPSGGRQRMAEYYDSTDEYDADYVTLPNIDLKKFTVRPRTTRPPTASPPSTSTSRIPATRFPDRRPTLQYFPPLKTPYKPMVEATESDFEKRVKAFTLSYPPNTETQFVTDPPVPVATMQPEPAPQPPPAAGALSPELRSLQATGAPPAERGSFIIRHYKDLLDVAAKDEEHDLAPPRPAPPRPAPADDASHEYDYDAVFRRDFLTRFMDNFNDQSERFKVEFPVLYNTSVVHREGGASSRVYLRRLGHGGARCDSCDVTVPLSPEYELHYYLPEQEERQEAELAPPRRRP